MKTALIVIIAILVLGGAIYAFTDRNDATDITVNGAANGVPSNTNSTSNTNSGATSTSIIGTVTNASSTLNASTTITLPKTGTITYTDNGFSPKNLIVAKGGTVTFINKSSSNMWVASDPHPTHNGYPGFDAKKSVANGAVYTFTFDKAGSWGYHNHVVSQLGGTIIVQ